MATVEDVHLSGTAAARPAATSVPAGAQYWATDTGQLSQSDGSSWTNLVSAGGSAIDLFPHCAAHTAPVDGDFSWVNQVSATINDETGGLRFTDVANASIDWHLRVKSAPSTPYTITGAFAYNGPFGVDFHNFGLVFRQSSDGKLHTFTISHNNTSFDAWTLFSRKYTDTSTFSATYTDDAMEGGPYPIVWLRIADNATNRICSISRDGVNFIQIHSVLRTDFLTADQVGFGWMTQNGTWGMQGWLLSWVEG